MTNQEIEIKFDQALLNERSSTNEIIQLINLIEDRKIHLRRGYSSLFDWLTRGKGYSEGAAQRRIQAARLLRSAPQIIEKLEKGDLNLSNLAKAQGVIRAHEKKGNKMSREQKAEVIEQVEKKSGIKAEQTLMGLFPDVASTVRKEHRNIIDEQTTRLSLNFSNEEMKQLERVRDLLSHSIPGASFSQIIAFMAADYLKRNDPLVTAVAAKRCVTKKSTDTAPARKTVSRPVRRVTIQRADGRCEYKDPQSGKICGATYQIETDHVRPRAQGGGNEESNLRCLCRAHNQLMAEELLGTKMANRWRGG